MLFIIVARQVVLLNVYAVYLLRSSLNYLSMLPFLTVLLQTSLQGSWQSVIETVNEKYGGLGYVWLSRTYYR